MQGRHKGIQIPSFEEAMKARQNILSQYPNSQSIYDDNIVWEVNGINVIICSIAEMTEIKEKEGTNGLNKKIKTVLEDFIDNTMDTILSMTDSVSDMQEAVKNDPTKNFKNLTKKMGKVMGVDLEVKEGDKNETKSFTQDGQEADTAEIPEERVEEVQDQETTDAPDGGSSEEREGERKEEDSSGDGSDEEKNSLTDEEIELISKKAEEVAAKDSDVQALRKVKDNPTGPSTGEMKPMMVNVNPNTGEHRITGSADDYLEDKETFEEMVERIENSDIEFDNSTPIDEKDALEFMADDTNSAFLKDMINEDDEIKVSPKAIQDLIVIANKKIRKEPVSAYKEFPDEIKKLIDNYIAKNGISPLDRSYKTFRKQISESLLEDFISNIQIDKVQKDFGKEIEDIFNKASNDIGEEIVGYTENKLAKYREAANNMEDSEKKEKLNKILDQIQEAYDLTQLKEFSKHCKIKKFDLEKPSKKYSRFLAKYDQSNYNIYSIDMARPILYRNLNTGDEPEFSDKDIDAFFIAFCKQTTNMSPDNPYEHAYMYYVIYNIVLADLNKSEKTKETSEKFMSNVKDIILNLRSRNQNVL